MLYNSFSITVTFFLRFLDADTSANIPSDRSDQARRTNRLSDDQSRQVAAAGEDLIR